MKKIVITGGLGYIGTELCKIYSGYSWNDQITVIDNRFISERVNQIRNWNMGFVQGDILDKEIFPLLQRLPKLTHRHFIRCQLTLQTSTEDRWGGPQVIVHGSKERVRVYDVYNVVQLGPNPFWS